jgi:lipoprotein signal peptidase
VARSAVVLLVVAAAVAAADLTHKAVVIADRGESLLYHERSAAYVLGVAIGALAWCAALVATRSLALALAGGLLLGGAMGNAISWALWPDYAGTPNPFFLGDEELGIAFNVADVFVVASVFVVLPIAIVAFVVRNRDRLGERVSFR